MPLPLARLLLPRPLVLLAWRLSIADASALELSEKGRTEGAAARPDPGFSEGTIAAVFFISSPLVPSSAVCP